MINKEGKLPCWKNGNFLIGAARDRVHWLHMSERDKANWPSLFLSIMSSTTKQRRKISHSLIEKRRREKINQCLLQLQFLVPSCQTSAMNKLDVLEHTVAYLQSTAHSSVSHQSGVLVSHQAQVDHQPSVHQFVSQAPPSPSSSTTSTYSDQRNRMSVDFLLCWCKINDLTLLNLNALLIIVSSMTNIKTWREWLQRVGDFLNLIFHTWIHSHVRTDCAHARR